MSQLPARAPSAWNIANYLTGVRLLLVPVFGWLLLAEDGRSPGLRWAAFGVFAVAMFTDRIDGDLARSRGLVTDVGKVIDPIADTRYLDHIDTYNVVSQLARVLSQQSA